jgi:hypothetical protein
MKLARKLNNARIEARNALKRELMEDQKKEIEKKGPEPKPLSHHHHHHNNHHNHNHNGHGSNGGMIRKKSTENIQMTSKLFICYIIRKWT